LLREEKADDESAPEEENRVLGEQTDARNQSHPEPRGAPLTAGSSRRPRSEVPKIVSATCASSAVSGG